MVRFIHYPILHLAKHHSTFAFITFVFKWQESIRKVAIKLHEKMSPITSHSAIDINFWKQSNDFPNTLPFYVRIKWKLQIFLCDAEFLFCIRIILLLSHTIFFLCVWIIFFHGSMESMLQMLQCICDFLENCILFELFQHP